MTQTMLAFIFVNMTMSFHLPSGMLSAVCYVESHHVVHALHVDDGSGPSLGVCQVKLATARMLGFRGSEADLMRPKINAFYAALYLNRQLERYNDDTAKAIAAYNSGTYRERAPGYPVNIDYVNKVYKAWLQKK